MGHQHLLAAVRLGGRRKTQKASQREHRQEGVAIGGDAEQHGLAVRDHGQGFWRRDDLLHRLQTQRELLSRHLEGDQLRLFGDIFRVVNRDDPSDGGLRARRPLHEGLGEQALDIQDLDHLLAAFGPEGAAQLLARLSRQRRPAGFNPVRAHAHQRADRVHRQCDRSRAVEHDRP